MNVLDLRLKAHNDGTDKIDYMVTEIKIDRELLADFDYYATDLRQLKRSIHDDGEFFILTCWCGYPLCAGIKRGIWVKHERNSVFWQVEHLHKTRRFVFDRTEYSKSFQNLIKQGNRLLSYLQSHGDKSLQMTPDINQQFFELGQSNHP